MKLVAEDVEAIELMLLSESELGSELLVLGRARPGLDDGGSSIFALRSSCTA